MRPPRPLATKERLITVLSALLALIAFTICVIVTLVLSF